MAIRFTGDFVVKKGREEVYYFLTDPSGSRRCYPNTKT